MSFPSCKQPVVHPLTVQAPSFSWAPHILTVGFSYCGWAQQLQQVRALRMCRAWKKGDIHSCPRKKTEESLENHYEFGGCRGYEVFSIKMNKPFYFVEICLGEVCVENKITWFCFLTLTWWSPGFVYKQSHVTESCYCNNPRNTFLRQSSHLCLLGLCAKSRDSPTRKETLCPLVDKAPPLV